MKNELVEVTEAALTYIDAIPEESASKFPVMPGFDRDWVDNVIIKSKHGYYEITPEALKLINSHPPLLSVLYDLQLLPEVIHTDNQRMAFAGAVHTFCHLNQIDFQDKVLIKKD